MINQITSNIAEKLKIVNIKSPIKFESSVKESASRPRRPTLFSFCRYYQVKGICPAGLCSGYFVAQFVIFVCQ